MSSGNNGFADHIIDELIVIFVRAGLRVQFSNTKVWNGTSWAMALWVKAKDVEPVYVSIRDEYIIINPVGKNDKPHEIKIQLTDPSAFDLAVYKIKQLAID